MSRFSNLEACIAAAAGLPHPLLRHLRAQLSQVLPDVDKIVRVRYWAGLQFDPDSAAVRWKMAGPQGRMEKVVVSDKAQDEELHPWEETTRIVRIAASAREVARLKEQPGGESFIFAGRTLWHHFMRHNLVNNLHRVVLPGVSGGGTTLVGFQPRVALELLEARTWDCSGNVLLRYRMMRCA